jgi:vacuolar-type H+-ATPase subunit H
VNQGPERHDLGALGSVRELEGALEATSAKRAASEARLLEARSEASRLLAAARDDAAAAAAERRRAALAAAEDDAAEIHRQGEERAARLRREAQGSCAAAVEAALALILSTGGESDA